MYPNRFENNVLQVYNILSVCLFTLIIAEDI